MSYTGVLLFIFSCSVVQTKRYWRAAEPFSRVGAWLYLGADNAGILLLGPDGVRTVYFHDREFSDEELAGLKSHLEQFPHLESLRLGNTKITDAGLNQVSELRLTHIELNGTQVTADGVEEFKRLNPECTVYWRAPFDDSLESEDTDPSPA